MNKKRLGFGIIGCGMIADFHINALKELSEHAVIIGVTDVVRDAALRLSNRHNLEIFESADEMLENKKIDVVCICTPSGYHADMIVKAANAKKHIIVEKPMAINSEQLIQAEKACAENKITLSVISQIRFARDINRAKFAVESGELGKIVCADMYMKYFRSQEYYDSGSWRGTIRLDGGGALMNQGIHGIDLLQYLAGPVVSVFGSMRTLVHKIEVEDTLSAVLEFENGALGIVQATTSVHPGYPRRLEINGEKGSITIEETSITKMDIHGSTTEDLVIKPSFASSASTASSISTDYHTAQILDVINAIREKRNPLVDIVEGKKAVDIILAIYKSAKENRKVFLTEMK